MRKITVLMIWVAIGFGCNKETVTEIPPGELKTFAVLYSGDYDTIQATSFGVANHTYGGVVCEIL